MLDRLAAIDPARLRVLALDVQDKPEAVAAFSRENRPLYTVLEAGRMNAPVPLQYGIGNPPGGGSVPVSILLAPDGSVAYAQGGFWTPSPLETTVRSLVFGR